ncbi:MAG: hypothetical protein WBW04_15785 [Nitrolancea sp.]
MNMFVLLYWACVLVVPFAAIGGLVIGVLASLSAIPERHRLTIYVLAAYVVFAVYIGLFAYLFVPAHYILGWDHTRGMADSLWEMHGEELLYANPNVSDDPARYAAVMHRIWHDRFIFLALWSSIAAAIGFAVGLALTSVRRLTSV